MAQWLISHRRLGLLTLFVALLMGGAWRWVYLSETLEDYDEDNYLSAAGTMRRHMDAGEWGQLSHVTNNREHPPLIKWMFALTLDADEVDDLPPPEIIRKGSRLDLPDNSLRAARLQSYVWGMATLLVVGLTNPLAALVLGGQTVHVHFSSVAYLDAWPTLFTALAVYLYTRMPAPSEKTPPRWLLWAVGGACLGASVAAKYPFALVGVAVVAHALLIQRFPLSRLALWGAVSLVVFFALNPYIWPDPVGRIREQLTFHSEYAERQHESHSLLTPYNQLINPDDHLPENMKGGLFIATDRLIFALAWLGLIPLLRARSVYAFWLVLGMLFLMFWNTQWIQHKMLILVPYSFSAAAGALWLAGLIRGRYQRRADENRAEGRRP